MRVGTVLSVIAGLAIGHQQAEAVILINEILADPPGLIGDANGDGVVSVTQDEFVELINTEPFSVALAGWSLADAVKLRHRFAGAEAIPPHGFFVVFGGGASSRLGHAATATSGALGLNNDGDTILLRDATGVLIDALSYGSEGGQDASLTRHPDAWGSFTPHNAIDGRPFSPGETVDGSALLAAPTVPSHVAAPEPCSALLIGAGLLMLGPLGRGRRSLPWQAPPEAVE